MTFVRYKSDTICFDYHAGFLKAGMADRLLKECDELFTGSQRQADLSLTARGNRRSNITFGDAGLVYTVGFKNQVYSREAVPWDKFPLLLKIKARAERKTGCLFNFCAIMCYPNGNIGIAKHRDKEMTGGCIAGVSVGAVRTFALYPRYTDDRDAILTPLAHGSMYVMNPPTNDKWYHEIAKDPSVEGCRYSLTFRTLPNEAVLAGLPRKVAVSKCPAILKSGVRKGTPCNKNVYTDKGYCGIHFSK